MICPYCKRLIHPDSFSCAHCGSYVRDYTANTASVVDSVPTFSSSLTSTDHSSQWEQGSAFEHQEENLTQQAGDQGEEWLLSRFGSYSQSKGVHLFARKRIPAGRQRREIDLLAVTTKRLYVFEAKNWTGALSLQGDTWIQIKRSGERRVCDHPITSTIDQAHALLQYLETKGIVIPDTLVSHKVFFVNPRLELDNAIARHPDVIYPSKLSYPINDEAIIDYCLHQDRRDPDRSGPLEMEARKVFARTVGEIHQLRTWDRIFLYGGGSYKGDVKRIRLGDEVFLQNDLAPGLSIQVQWPHGEPDTLLKQLLGVKPGKLVLAEDQEFAVGTDDSILFHKAGQSEPILISLEKIEKIVIG